MSFNSQLAKAEKLRKRAVKDRELTTANFQNQIVQKQGKEDVLDVILHAFDVRLRAGIYPLEMTLKSVQGTADKMNFDKFSSTFKRLGLTELSADNVRQLFQRYSNNDGLALFSSFVKDVVQRKKEQSQASFPSCTLYGISKTAMPNKSHKATMRNRAIVAKAFDMDIEQVLLEKIEQRQKSGANSCGLARAFRKFDVATTKSVIGIDEFQRRIKMMGLDVSEAQARELLDKYDINKTGNLDFKDFCDGVMKSYAHQNSFHIGGRYLAPKRMAAKRLTEQKRQAVAKKSWNSLKLDFRKLLVDKIEQRITSQHQLRTAFRKFDTGTEVARIHLPEFRHGIKSLGLQLTDVEALEFFRSLTDGDSIDFQTFANFFQKGDGFLDTSAVLGSECWDTCKPRHKTSSSSPSGCSTEKHKSRSRRHAKHKHCRHRESSSKLKTQVLTCEKDFEDPVVVHGVIPKTCSAPDLGIANETEKKPRTLPARERRPSKSCAPATLQKRKKATRTLPPLPIISTFASPTICVHHADR